MTYTGHIVAEPSPARGSIQRRLRVIRAQASFIRPRLWTSYVIARDLRQPLIGSECTPQIRISRIFDASHPDFEQLARISRRMGISRIRCAQYLQNGAVASLAHVQNGPTTSAAAMGWVTQSPTPVPFLNARFAGGPHSCLLYQDYVLPEFRGLGLQRMIGRHRLTYAVERGVRWAYGYIRRANTPSLRNAIGFTPVALVHNIRCGHWAAHVRSLGHRKCDELPFVHWPHRQAFFITPGTNRRLA